MDRLVAKTHVRLRLEAVYKSLTPTEQRVCDFVLQNPEQIIHFTISELSKAAGVSDATVTRLCQSVGYHGYPEFRVLLARDLATLQQMSSGELRVTDAIDDIRDKIITGSVQSISDTRYTLDSEVLRNCAACIAQANRIDVYGIGGSACVAQDICHKFIRLGIIIVAYSDADLMSISSATLSVRDLAIGVSHTGRSESVVDAIRRAKTGGAATIALTHNPLSPLAKSSDFVLQYAARPTAFSNDSLSGRLSQLVVADLLYTLIAFSSFDRSAQLIDQANTLANKRRLA
jgi:DNA-binding MurR/RpiR family transcriptional regulator